MPVPYITALWGVRARLTSWSGGACLRFGGDGAAADTEPVREGNGGGRGDDEELSAAHAGDQNRGECNPQQRKYRPCRETRSEEHTSELQSRLHLVCRLLLEKKKG